MNLSFVSQLQLWVLPESKLKALNNLMFPHLHLHSQSSLPLEVFFSLLLITVRLENTLPVMSFDIFGIVSLYYAENRYY